MQEKSRKYLLQDFVADLKGKLEMRFKFNNLTLNQRKGDLNNNEQTNSVDFTTDKFTLLLLERKI